MHALLPKPWRHRLVALHVAAGAGMLGAGVMLLTWSGSWLPGGLPGGGVAISVLAAHLALVAAVLGVVALGRVRHRRSGSGPEAGRDVEG